MREGEERNQRGGLTAPYGGMAERPNAPVLKTGDGKPSVGSNPTPSAIRRYGVTVTHQTSNLVLRVQVPLSAPCCVGVVELADTSDLGSDA